MYKRENLVKENPTVCKNPQKRTRNVLMNFRVTPEEKEKIERRMELSGLTKQDFFIQSLMYQKVLCIGNIKTFETMKRKMYEINEHLLKINSPDELDEKLLESLRMILELYAGLNIDEK